MKLGTVTSATSDDGHARRRTQRVGAVPSFLAILIVQVMVWIYTWRALRQWRVLRTAGPASHPRMTADQADASRLRAGSSERLLPVKRERPGQPPEAFDNPTSLPGEAMTTVPEPIAARRLRIGEKQLSALMRWHGAKTQMAVLTELSQQPHFPLIETGGQPIPRSRFRGPRRPNGGGHHAA